MRCSLLPLHGFVLAMLMFTVPSLGWAQRVALLIGNASYEAQPLIHPPADVAVLEASLKAIGFQVKTLRNANQNQMKRAIIDFGTQATGAEVALVYYSGHGTQVAGENYLVPIGASLGKSADYEVEAVSANVVLRQIVGASPKTAIVILDACRDNPFASATKSGTKGLAPMPNVPTGTLVAFATAPNDVAQDNGHYARALAAELRKRGQELLDVFRNTNAEVRRLSGGKQVPRLSDISITDRIYLAGQDPAGQATSPPSRPMQVAPPAQRPEPAPSVVSAAPKPGTVIKDCDVCPELVVLPQGSFVMGSPDNEPLRDQNEGPQRTVRINYTLAVGRYEVTQGEWKAVMGSNPSQFSSCGDTCPVEMVSWDMAQEYLKKLNAKSGQQYRLLSEAEWEYAARAGTTTPFHTGQTITSEQANFVGDKTYNGSAKGWFRNTTTKVGSFDANAFGLYDMHGNVFEWVEDVWHDNYTGAPTDGSVWKVGGDASRRVVRGGSWSHGPRYLRSADRFTDTPDLRVIITGFRIARTFTLLISNDPQQGAN